jgi:hypothetical protein
MKKIILLASLAFSLNAFAQIPTNGLIGYYPFTGNANDLSGNNNNGAVTGAALTTDRFGNTNSAYNFPNANDNITIDSITASNVLKYSVSGWFQKTSSSVNLEGNIFCGSNPCNAPGGLRFSVGVNNQACFGAEFQSCSSMWSYTSNQNYADNTWHSFVVVFDGVAGLIDTTMLKIYIDNIFVAQHKQTQGNLSNVIAPINNALPTILGNATGGNDNFKGKLDDIRIYNRVLNTSEISALYNEGLCYQTITVTDTLLINTNITGFNPVTYQNTIKVWPNPTNDHITIDNGNIANLTGYQIKITNSLSQQVFQSAITQQQFYVDLSTWTGNGIYFVHIIDGQGNTIDIKKIVLQ